MIPAATCALMLVGAPAPWVAIPLPASCAPQQDGAAGAGPVEQPQAQWRFTLEPYLWLASIDGNGSAGSAPPSDIGQNLSPFGEIDGGFLLACEARSPDGRFSVFGDGLYLSLADEEGSVQTSTDALMLEAGAGFALGDGSTWEAITGLRYVDLDYGVDLANVASESVHKDWIDPWVGARGRIGLSESWTLALRADVGGFGIGSQFTWQALAAFQVELGKGVRLDFGYRSISLDFDDDDLEYDVLVRGPLVGLAFRL